MGEEATMGLELVAGKIVGKNMPTGHTHGIIELNIGSALRQYAREHKSGQVMVGEVGIPASPRIQPQQLAPQLRQLRCLAVQLFLAARVAGEGAFVIRAEAVLPTVNPRLPGSFIHRVTDW